MGERERQSDGAVTAMNTTAGHEARYQNIHEMLQSPDPTVRAQAARRVHAWQTRRRAAREQQGQKAQDNQAAPDHFVNFEPGEVDTVEVEIPQQTRDQLKKADVLAERLGMRYVNDSTVQLLAALGALQNYASNKIKAQGRTADYFAHEPRGIAGMAFKKIISLIEHVPVMGSMMHEGISAFFELAPEEMPDPSAMVKAVLARMGIAQAKIVHALPSVLQKHKNELRNAYLAVANQDDAAKEAAITGALAGIGISAPTDDGAALYQGLVTALNIEAWIAACRSGGVGRTADCAVDADVTTLRDEARDEAKQTYGVKP